MTRLPSIVPAQQQTAQLPSKLDYLIVLTITMGMLAAMSAISHATVPVIDASEQTKGKQCRKC